MFLLTPAFYTLLSTFVLLLQAGEAQPALLMGGGMLCQCCAC